jgi:hypothetical protein
MKLGTYQNMHVHMTDRKFMSIFNNMQKDGKQFMFLFNTYVYA